MKTVEQLEMQKIGQGIKSELDKFFAQWGLGLLYRNVFTKYSATANKLGISVSVFSDEMESLGFCRITRTPTGKRYVFPVEVSEEDAQSKAMDMEHDLEQEKQANKASK